MSKAYLVFLAVLAIACESNPRKEMNLNLEIKPSRNISSEKEQEYQIKIDPTKQTACFITLNSDEEKTEFTKNIRTKMNIVELADAKKKVFRFEEAIAADTRCDLIVISGHFAGTFMGNLGLSLRLEELESKSCDPRYAKLLRSAKEVYLFGCNTLASKEKDRRSPEEYIQVLMQDGFSSIMAQQIAAFRYSPLGAEFKDRMRKVFSNSKTHIYGFSSIGPSGKTVLPFLEKYFLRTKNYTSFFSGRKDCSLNDSEQEDLFVKSLNGTAITKTCGDSKTERPICLLNSNKKISEKINWIDSVLSDSNLRLLYINNIEAYLHTVDRSFNGNWPEAEQSYFEKLQFNLQAKKQFLEFTNIKSNYLIGPQLQILRFAKTLGWINANEYYKKITEVLDGDIFKDLNTQLKDIICGIRPQLDLPFEVLPNRPLTSNEIDAISCMGVQTDEKTHMKIYSDMVSNENIGGYLAREILRKAPKSSKLLEFYFDEFIRTFTSNYDLMDQETFDLYRNKKISYAESLVRSKIAARKHSHTTEILSLWVLPAEEQLTLLIEYFQKIDAEGGHDRARYEIRELLSKSPPRMAKLYYFIKKQIEKSDDNNDKLRWLAIMINKEFSNDEWVYSNIEKLVSSKSDLSDFFDAATKQYFVDVRILNLILDQFLQKNDDEALKYYDFLFFHGKELSSNLSQQHINRILKMLASNDKSQARKAIKFVSKLNRKEFIRPLLELLHNEHFTIEVARALTENRESIAKEDFEKIDKVFVQKNDFDFQCSVASIALKYIRNNDDISDKIPNILKMCRPSSDYSSEVFCFDHMQKKSQLCPEE